MTKYCKSTIFGVAHCPAAEAYVRRCASTSNRLNYFSGGGVISVFWRSITLLLLWLIVKCKLMCTAASVKTLLQLSLLLIIDIPWITNVNTFVLSGMSEIFLHWTTEISCCVFRRYSLHVISACCCQNIWLFISKLHSFLHHTILCRLGLCRIIITIMKIVHKVHKKPT